jgi:hypothetical protein
MSAFDAIIDALLPEWPPIPSEYRASLSVRCARFVRQQIALAPAHIGLGIRVLFLAFCAFSFLRLGMRRLRSVSREQRIGALQAFAGERAPFAALERLLRSMTLVAFLEDPRVLRSLGEEASPSCCGSSSKV